MTDTTDPVQEALDAYLEAGDRYREVATEELRKLLRSRYPTGAEARVTVYLSESLTEHTVQILDGDGATLNEADDWPYDGDDEFERFVVLSEGAAIGAERVTIDLAEEVP